jgi:DoxX-like family
MNTQKRNRIFYWVLTLLVLLPTAGSAIPELFAGGTQSIVQSYQTLGYPLYLMKILGFAKILGAVVLLTDRSRRIMEWAYAGFGILFLGATASHLLAGDSAHAPIPLLFFVILAGSYAFWSRSKAQSFEHLQKM